MNLSLNIIYFLTATRGSTYAFQPRANNLRQVVPSSTSTLYADTAISNVPTEESKSSVKSLGLLTFDLDDTLYPIAPIIEDANGMFCF